MLERATTSATYEERGTGWTGRRVLGCILVVGTLLPPAYLFVMMQYGAITLPYWDHVVTANHIIRFFDGTLTIHDLVEAQAQARPLFPRLIFIANAALTRWDIRSEYFFIAATVYGALGALLFAFWAVVRNGSKLIAVAAALLISIIACSPGGAMNYYWSLMLLATLAYMCAIFTFLIVSLRLSSWTANVLAAALAWIAAYSISQGLFIFPVMFLLHQATSQKPLLLSRFSAFWLVNLIVCYAVYLPSLPPPTNSMHPTFVNFVAFVVVYVGNPLGALLWFPFLGAIDLLQTSIINAICGVIIIVLSMNTLWRARANLRARQPEAMIFFSLTMFALACTVVTAWGRANDLSYPVSSANSSRYSIFAACFMFALIFYYAPKFARRDLSFGLSHKIVFALFVLASTISYARGIAVYQVEHRNNEWLSDAYPPDGRPTDFDIMAFPDVNYVRRVKQDLLRLGIGPYRSLGRPSAAVYSGAFREAVPLLPGTVITQRFHAAYPRIRFISFVTLTWGNTPSPYLIHWSIVGLNGETRTLIGEGAIKSSDWLDWRTAIINVPSAPEQQSFEVTFSVDKSAVVENYVGVGLYPTSADPFSPAEINGIARSDGSKVGLRVGYQ